MIPTPSTDFSSDQLIIILQLLAEWTEVPIADIIPKTIAKLGNRVMFGAELGSRACHCTFTYGIANLQVLESEKRAIHRPLHSVHD